MALSRRAIFLAFLGLGLLTGLFAGRLGKALAAPAAPGSILIALADDLSSAEPSLLGLWLVQQSDDGAWAWTPIYPTPLEGNASGLYAHPHAAIRLSTTHLQDPDSLTPLGRALAPEQVFWLDQTALGLLQQLADGQSAALSPTWSGPQRALREQVESINALCQGAAQAANPAALDAILALLPWHLRTSRSPFELITAWDNWLQQSAPIACSHPWAE